MSPSRYRMQISLNVLNHLGLNLYSNRPAVLSEVIANAWDADASEVRVDFHFDEKSITISDDGNGMDLRDVNEKFLFVGYKKRVHEPPLTGRDRKPMGRKGIGKLSLFSIANKIHVYTRRSDKCQESFLMDADAIQAAIESDDPSSSKIYQPEHVPDDVQIPNHGTVIKITDLKKVTLNQQTATSLKKRIARRFGIIGTKYGFHVFVNGNEITVSDRDYFHKARFLFRYGNEEFEEYCENLDVDPETEKSRCFIRSHRFDANGKRDDTGTFCVRGWIAIAGQSSDLDGHDGEDNLNRITLMVRGKVAQEDVLQTFRIGGMITKFLFGEIYADFLDEDHQEDIATSGRQSIAEDDLRYQALTAFIESELKFIWTKSNALKAREGLHLALNSNSSIREWYERLSVRSVRNVAQRLFGVIEQASIEARYKPQFYASTVLAIETFRAKETLDTLQHVDVDNIESFLKQLSDLDALEAEKYRQIVTERLGIINTLEQHIRANEYEKIIQDFLFNRLWLLDPAWERATEFAVQEQTVQTVVEGIPSHGRIDIRYKRVMAGHVIVELKRPHVRVRKTELEEQALKYLDAVRNELRQTNEAESPLEAVCIVDTLPYGWDDPERRARDEQSLHVYSIRVITYKELIKNARQVYTKFIAATSELEWLRKLTASLRDHTD